MGHNPNLILLGSTQSSVKEVTCERADSTVFKAGLAVRKATNGGLQLNDDGTAVLIGISLGPDLSGAKGHTAVCRTGNYVPIVLKNDAASVKIGAVTFTSKLFGTVGNDLSVTISDSLTGNTALVTVVGNDIIISIDDGVTTNDVLAAAVLAHGEASALITAVVDGGAGAGFVAAAVETPLVGGSNVAVPGQPVLIDDVTGQASVDGDTTAALYISGVLTGMYPDGTTVPAAWVAMPGGF